MSYSIRTEKTWAETRQAIRKEFERWARLRGAEVAWDVENIRDKHMVTLRYQHAGEPEVVLTMGSQRRAEDNLRVLYLALEALRLNEARGIADVVRAAYLALPAPAVERDPYEVLGVRSDTPPAVIEASYKALAKLYHPDSGIEPDAARMAEVNAAYERLRGDRG